jgi:hypothetical protein
MIVIDPKLEKDFPNFVALLRSMVDIYKSKPEAFKKSLQEYSELTDAEIIEYLTVSETEGPIITSETLDARMSPKTGKQIPSMNGLTGPMGQYIAILINKRILNLYEHSIGNGDLSDVKSQIYELLESTLFHEFTHFGDLKKGGLPYTQTDADTGKEGGKKFEAAAYKKDNTLSDILGTLGTVKYNFYSTQTPQQTKKKDEKKDEKPKPKPEPRA